MSKRNRWIALAIASLLATTALSGCAGGGQDAASNASQAPASQAPASQAPESQAPEASTEAEATPEPAAANDPFGKYETPIEITVAKSLGSGNLDFPEGDSIDDNVWTRTYAEALGVNVKFLWTANEGQYKEKVNIAITSDDLPDVMAVTNTQLKMMVDNDQLMDMTTILPDNMAPFTAETMNADGGFALKSATFDGKLMAIPQIGSGLGSAKVLWVRTDWLEKLNLGLPTTVEDMLAVAEAFTTQDPDGNGKADTFGLGVHKDLFDGGYAALEGFFNVYNAYPNIWVKKDDGIAYGTIQPEVKMALQSLQDLYKKGQIDPEFGVKDANKVNEDVMAGRIGMFFGDFWNAAWMNPAKEADPTFEWKPIALPGSGTKAQLPFGTTWYYAVSKECKNPEALVRMLNLQLEKCYGETAEPTKFSITPEGYGPYQYTVLYVEPPMKNFDAAEKVSAAITKNDPAGLNDEQKNYYDMSLLSLGGDHSNNNWHQLKMFGPEGALTVMKKYWDDGNVVQDEFFGAPTQTMTEKLPTLKKQAQTDFTSIILGGSIDDFDTFVENWNSLGGTAMTEEVNAWYKAQ